MSDLKRAEPYSAAVEAAVARIKRVKTEKGWPALLESDLARTSLSLRVAEELFDALPNDASRLCEILQSKRYHVTTLGQLVDFCKAEVSEVSAGQYSIRGQDASDEDSTFLALILSRFKRKLAIGSISSALALPLQAVNPGVGFDGSIATLLDRFDKEPHAFVPVNSVISFGFKLLGRPASTKDMYVRDAYVNTAIKVVKLQPPFPETAINNASLYAGAASILTPLSSASAALPLSESHAEHLAPNASSEANTDVNAVRGPEVVGEVPGLEHRGSGQPGADEVLKKCYSNVILGGSKGIGKSVFGMYLLLMYLDLGALVIYEFNEFKLLIISEKVDVAVFGEVQMLLANLGIHVRKGAVYDMDSQPRSTWNRLQTIEEVRYIHDVAANFDASIGLQLSSCVRTILTSPGSTRFKALVSQEPSLTYVYMSTWSLNELSRLNDLLLWADTDASSKSSKRHKSQEEIIRLYKCFGGIPRHIFWTDEPEVLLESVLSRITTVEDLRALFLSRTYSELGAVKDIESIGMLLEIRCTSRRIYPATQLMRSDKESAMPVVEIATDYIRSRLELKFNALKKTERERFTELAEGSPSMVSFVGSCFKQRAHMLLPLSTTRRSIIALSSPGAQFQQWCELALDEIRDAREIVRFEG